jgi:hypothetical protein
MKKYYSTHNTCTKYTQNVNITCDEPIKNACHQKINRILLTYLSAYSYLPMPIYAYLPTYLFLCTYQMVGLNWNI